LKTIREREGLLVFVAILCIAEIIIYRGNKQTQESLFKSYLEVKELVLVSVA
jgi:hypothetical protein